MRSSSMALICLAFVHTAALADGTAPDAAAPAPAAAMAPATGDSGMRLRNGFSLSASQEYGSGPSSGLTGSLFGGDWRIGAKLDRHHAVYLHTHLSFGSAEIGQASGVTANFAAAVLAERTLPQRIFVAGGGGYGVLNNPSGPLAQLRLGWYPMKRANDDVARRLNFAVDARWYFAGEAVGTVTQLAFTIGYDRF